MSIDYFKPYDWNCLDIDNKFNRIEIFCHNRDSEACLIRIDDHPIRIMLELPNEVKWTKENLWDVVHQLRSQSCFINGRTESVISLMNGGFKSVNLHGFNNYLDGERYYLIVYFNTTAGMYAAKTLIESKTYSVEKLSNLKISVCETEVDAVKKFTVEQKLKYADWLSASVEEVTDEHEKISTFKHEYTASYKNIFPVPKEESVEWKVYPIQAAFDIETHSNNKLRFPDPLNPKCPITTISIAVEKIGKSDTRKKYSIVTTDCIPPKDAIIYYEKDEIDALKRFCIIINELEVDILTGHNILNYDFEYMHIRLTNMWGEWLQCSSRIKNRRSTYKDESWSSNNNKMVGIKYINFPGRIYADTLNICKNIIRLPNYKLETIAQTYLKRGKHDVKPEEMFEAFDEYHISRTMVEKCIKTIECNKITIHDNISEGAWDHICKKYIIALNKMGKLIEYCNEDSVLVLDLFNKLNMWETMCQFSNIIQVKIKEVYTKGQQFKGISQLYSLLYEYNVVFNHIYINVRKEKYEGALNLGSKFKKTGLFHDLFSGDINSMYPSIMRENNICISTEITVEKAKKMNWTLNQDYVNQKWIDYPGTSKEYLYDLNFVKKEVHLGFIPILVNRLLTERSATKQEMKGKEGTDLHTILNAKQEALKLSANSIYGLLGITYGAKLAAKHLAALVTKIGRDTLLKMVAYINHGGNPNQPPVYPKGVVVYGDTDSVQFYIETKFENSIQFLDYGHKYIKEICTYMHPLKLDLEKAGNMMLIGPKKYVFHLYDQNKYLATGEANRAYGEWHSYKYTGVELVKRNQTKIIHRLYKSITELIMDPNYRLDVQKEERELLRLQQVIDAIFIGIVETLYFKYPISDYYISEAYNTDNRKTKMGQLAMRMATLGKPMNLGERVYYTYVKWPGMKKVKIGEKMRLYDDIHCPETIDTECYVERMATPINGFMKARYNNTDIYKNFLKNRDVVSIMSELILDEEFANSLPNRRVEDIYICTIKQLCSKNPRLKDLQFDFDEVVNIKESVMYLNLTKADKTSISKTINTINNIGFPILIDVPNIVTNILLADKLGVLEQYTKCMTSKSVYNQLYK